MPAAEPAHQHAADAGPQGERAHRHDRRDDRQAAGAGNPEAKQDDVARHVGREHVAQAEIADRVDRPGGKVRARRASDSGWRMFAAACSARGRVEAVDVTPTELTSSPADHRGIRAAASTR
jgi:hypothetical protein